PPGAPKSAGLCGGLGRQGADDFAGDVAASTTVRHDRGDAPDRAPRDAPPAAQERDQGERRPLPEDALSPLDEMDVGHALEGEDDDRDAVLVDHEPPASLDLVLELVRRHVLDTPDLHARHFSTGTGPSNTVN